MSLKKRGVVEREGGVGGVIGVEVMRGREVVVE